MILKYPKVSIIRTWKHTMNHRVPAAVLSVTKVTRVFGKPGAQTTSPNYSPKVPANLGFIAPGTL